jgi:uncharacterized damage-inducible protein DinB
MKARVLCPLPNGLASHWYSTRRGGKIPASNEGPARYDVCRVSDRAGLGSNSEHCRLVKFPLHQIKPRIQRLKSSFVLEPPSQPLPAAHAFLRQARFRLREDYLVKINAALADFTDERIWWRPNEASNSIGNLILHLCGNARQWIIAGVGGTADTRQRASEFARLGNISKNELLALLTKTLEEVDASLARLESELASAGSDAPLQRACVAQGFAQTVLDAVFHVVEHFSYHTGQIILLAKWHAAGRIRLYDDRRLNLES